MASSRVVLVGCVKLKADHAAPAKELYRSSLWRRRRRYAEASGCRWMILSAKHGLLDPDERVAPYDLSARERRAWGSAWGERVVRGLGERLGSLAGTTFEVHAGAAYRRAIERGIAERGGTVTQPLAGLGLGEQLAWYTSGVGRKSRSGS